jgi:hypothetical protein
MVGSLNMGRARGARSMVLRVNASDLGRREVM